MSKYSYEVTLCVYPRHVLAKDIYVRKQFCTDTLSNASVWINKVYMSTHTNTNFAGTNIRRKTLCGYYGMPFMVQVRSHTLVRKGDKTTFILEVGARPFRSSARRVDVFRRGGSVQSEETWKSSCTASLGGVKFSHWIDRIRWYERAFMKVIYKCVELK